VVDLSPVTVLAGHPIQEVVTPRGQVWCSLPRAQWCPPAISHLYLGTVAVVVLGIENYRRVALVTRSTVWSASALRVWKALLSAPPSLEVFSILLTSSASSSGRNFQPSPHAVNVLSEHAQSTFQRLTTWPRQAERCASSSQWARALRRVARCR
jgi:hypothetical protein